MVISVIKEKRLQEEAGYNAELLFYIKAALVVTAPIWLLLPIGILIK